MFLENRSQSTLVWAQLVRREIMHATQHGIGAGKDHSVRGQCDWHRSISTLKTHAVGRERVNVGSANLLVAIATKMVGAQRVNCNYYHVRRRNRRGEDRRRPKYHVGSQQEYKRRGENHLLVKLY